MTFRIDGDRYEIMVHPLNVTNEFDRLTIDVGARKPVNKCETCGRADWVDDVVHSFDEAERRGWIRKIEEAS